MNRCSGYYQPSATAASGAVVCPKPRRIALLNPSISNGLPYVRETRLNPYFVSEISYLTEIPDSRAGMELLDTIFTKGSYGVEKSNIQEASSPPLFCGSPPSRASNPLIQDSQFGNYGLCPSPQAAILSTSPSSACIVGSCNQIKFGHKPAVRIEGFDCTDRDHRSVFVIA